MGDAETAEAAEAAEVRESGREPGEELNVLTDAVIGAAIEVHRVLGPGFLESFYEQALCMELAERAIPFARQAGVTVFYKGIPPPNPSTLCALRALCVLSHSRPNGCSDAVAALDEERDLRGEESAPTRVPRAELSGPSGRPRGPGRRPAR